MLAAITSELRTELQGRGVPYQVVYGPERVDQSVLARSHVVVQRDRQLGDSVDPAPAKHHNPHAIFVRWIGAMVTVYARSLESGATVAEHERIADMVADQIMLSLRVIVARRKSAMRFAGVPKLLSRDELEARELLTWPGVVYELRLAVGRGVRDAAYDGEGAVEKAAGADFGVSTTLDTSASPGANTDLPGATTRAS